MRMMRDVEKTCGSRVGFSALLLVVLLAAVPARASLDPKSTVERAVAEIIGVLTDSGLAAEEKREQRHRLVVAKVEKFFDFTEISMRVMGPRWRDLNGEQRQQFVDLFKQFLEKNYIDRVDQYSGEEVVVRDQEIRGRFAMVNTDFFYKNQPVPVSYRLLNRDGSWVVYDVNIEGVSLVRNFRTQFDPYSYDELVRRMQQQIATGQGLEPM